MAKPHSIDLLPQDQRQALLTQWAQRVLRRYRLDHAQPVVLQDSSSLMFRIPPPARERDCRRCGASAADATGFVLRVHEATQHDTQAIDEELQWLTAIRRDTALVVPTPVPARDGSLIQNVALPGESLERCCVLFRWVDGELRNDPLQPADLQRLGAFMARLHEHANGFVTTATSRPTRRAFGDFQVWRNPSGGVAAHFGVEELTAFAAVAERAHCAIMALGEGADVFGFIHADLHPWNILFRGDQVRAIDFDDCGWGHYGYDIAVTLSYFEDWPTFPSLRDAFVRGYQTVRPLPAHALEHLDVLIATRMLVMIAWILDVPRASDIPWGPRYLKHAVTRIRRLVASFDGNSNHPT